MDCARKLIAADGVTALWKGFGPAMARAFPANVSDLRFSYGLKLSIPALTLFWQTRQATSCLLTRLPRLSVWNSASR